MRATYASGVAESLQRAGLVPDAIYGTSAGGAIGAWYAAGQADVGARTWDHVNDRALMSWRRALLQRGPMLDFRTLYGERYRSFFKMDIARLRAASYPVYATVTDAETLETLYLDLRVADDPFAVLHATSAIPILAEAPVRIDGRPLVDGGTTDPIPVKRALEDGWRDIVVVSNRPAGQRPPESELAIRVLGLKFPRLVEAARKHHTHHNEAIRIAEDPPEGARIRLVRPARELGVSRLTRDVGKLRAAIDVGRRDGARLAAELGLQAPAPFSSSSPSSSAAAASPSG